jgi:Calcineurin-like phosphoesterase
LRSAVRPRASSRCRSPYAGSELTAPRERDAHETGCTDTQAEQTDAPLGNVPSEKPLDSIGQSPGVQTESADAARVDQPADMSASVGPPVALPVLDVRHLDWQAVRRAADPQGVRARMRAIVERMEALLDKAGGPGLLFDADRTHESDRAIKVSAMDSASPLWIIGDLHGDLLALESALMLIGGPEQESRQTCPRIIFLGDLFDDEGFGLEVLLRVFELIVDTPERICVLTGNHDEALSYDGVHFASSVEPADFAEHLNANFAHEWIERAGKLAVRLFARAPRALFFPDGMLIAHGGFPLVDLHPRLMEKGDWNDPACLSDFVWTRAHPTARKKLPNRFSRGSQFGYEDFAAFCAVAARLGRPVTHLVRGHDHVEERYAVYPAYHAHPVLTTIALSRRLSRELIGSYERVPTLARVVERALPQVYRLHVPADMIRDIYAEHDQQDGREGQMTGDDQT